MMYVSLTIASWSPERERVEGETDNIYQCGWDYEPKFFCPNPRSMTIISRHRVDPDETVIREWGACADHALMEASRYGWSDFAWPPGRPFPPL